MDAHHGDEDSGREMGESYVASGADEGCWWGSWLGATASHRDATQKQPFTVRDATKNSGSAEAKKVKVNEDNPVGCLYYLLLNEPFCQI